MEAVEVKRRRIWSVGSPSRLKRTFEPQPPSTLIQPSVLGEHYRVGDWLGGGEPTLRSDFLELLKACGAPSSLRTDGLALTEPSVVQTLKSHGVERVCIPIFSIRPDAHDWVVGFPGAARRSLKALRVCVEAGLQVHVDLIPTRSTAGLLMETVGVLGRLGVHTLWFRRPRIDWMSPDDVLSLTPRMGLLEPELISASAAAKRLGMRVEWVGFSTVSVEAAREGRWAEDQWLDEQGNASTTEATHGSEEYPMDYIQRFGWTEFRGGPDTRVDAVVRRVFSPGGAFPRGDSLPQAVRIAFGAPVPNWDEVYQDPVAIEPSRVIRQRMVEASQLGARELVVCNSGALQHPDAEDLLWEMTRLSFEHVRLAAELSPLAGCSQRVFRRFKGIHRVDGIWFGPSAEQHDERLGQVGAFDSIEPVLHGFKEYAGAEVGLYALLHSADELPAYLERFKVLGYTPHFRLMKGINTHHLADFLKTVDDDQIQRIIGALLPEEVWSGPRAATESALPAWGHGEPYWVSRIDKCVPPV